mmetsp:Transcript_35371/g.40946  ORF Transcript_35371/g.40946 Transcript_35371/m.40946 type:complete len:111 (-) Transcript_35371:28-360(-)
MGLFSGNTVQSSQKIEFLVTRCGDCRDLQISMHQNPVFDMVDKIGNAFEDDMIATKFRTYFALLIRQERFSRQITSPSSLHVNTILIPTTNCQKNTNTINIQLNFIILSL